MYGTFSFNGISSREYTLISRTVSKPLFPTMKPRTVEIFGKHGLYDYGSNTYQTRQITMHVEYLGDSLWELRNRTRSLAAWLHTTDWADLVFDEELDKLYKARVYGQVDFDSLIRHGKCDITFECQPFAFLVASTGDEDTWDEADYPWLIEIPWQMSDSYQVSVTGSTTLDFENVGSVEISNASPQASQFDITISGTWTAPITLALNGNSLTYSAASTGDSTLVIDCIDMEVTLNGSNALATMGGDLDEFFTIATGSNTLTITVTGTSTFNLLVDFVPQWL